MWGLCVCVVCVGYVCVWVYVVCVWGEGVMCMGVCVGIRVVCVYVCMVWCVCGMWGI